MGHKRLLPNTCLYTIRYHIFNYGLLTGANAYAFYRRALNSNLDLNIDYLE
jgi:hypothetical protein